MITELMRRHLKVIELESREPASTVFGVTATNNLLRFDLDVGGTILSTVAITGLQSVNERVIGIDFRPRTGQLYATTVPTGVPANALLRTYSISPLTGAATFVGSIPNTVPGAADVAGGYDFNPTVDRIRVGNVNDENFRINPNNGSLAGDDPNLNPGAFQIIGLSYDRNFDRANATTIPTTLYGISRATSSLVTQGGINGMAPGGANGGMIAGVGPLGVTLDAGADAGFDIPAGSSTGVAAFSVGGTNGLYRVNLQSGGATLVAPIQNNTAVTGLAAVPDSRIAVGSDAGAPANAGMLNGFTGFPVFGVSPYPGFTGGVRVAAGDVSGDGVPDLITAAGPGGGPHVRVFDGVSGAQLPGAIGSFFAYGAAFSGGVFVASGDVNGDGFDDVITGADAGGGPHVRAFSGQTGAELVGFLAYDPAFAGGVRVAAADFNLDGRAEIVTGAGAGGGPHVRVFDNMGAPATGIGIPNSFFAYAPAFAGGVFVSAGDVNGDGRPDIISGAGAGGGPHVKAFSGVDGSTIDSFLAYEPGFTGGVRVGVADLNQDGRYEIRVASGPGRPAEVRAFDGTTGGAVGTFVPFGGPITGTFLGGERAS
jgi:Domain of unknown function (DUF4394)/FG-GAP-like repeat/FG-GAP repeat